MYQLIAHFMCSLFGRELERHVGTIAYYHLIKTIGQVSNARTAVSSSFSSKRSIEVMAFNHTADAFVLGSEERAGDSTDITASLNESVAAYLDRIIEAAMPPRSAVIELHIGEIKLSVEVRQID